MNEHRVTSVEELRRIVAEPRGPAALKVTDHLDAQAIEFLAGAPFLLLATTGQDGTVEVSPKGDEPGFVLLEDPRTVVIPDRPGNNLAFGLTNILENPQVGVIVLRPPTGETLRFSGSAEILTDPALLDRLAARGRPAVLAIRIHIERAYFHCARAVFRSGLWDPETWPKAQRVSFGRILAGKLGGAETLAQDIDERVAANYHTNL